VRCDAGSSSGASFWRRLIGRAVVDEDDLDANFLLLLNARERPRRAVPTVARREMTTDTLGRVVRLPRQLIQPRDGLAAQLHLFAVGR